MVMDGWGRIAASQPAMHTCICPCNKGTAACTATVTMHAYACTYINVCKHTHLGVAAQGDHLVHLLELQRDLPEACRAYREGRRGRRSVDRGVHSKEETIHTYHGQREADARSLDPRAHIRLQHYVAATLTAHELLQALPPRVVVALAGLVPTHQCIALHCMVGYRDGWAGLGGGVRRSCISALHSLVG